MPGKRRLAQERASHPPCVCQMPWTHTVEVMDKELAPLQFCGTEAASQEIVGSIEEVCEEKDTSYVVEREEAENKKKLHEIKDINIREIEKVASIVSLPSSDIFSRPLGQKLFSIVTMGDSKTTMVLLVKIRNSNAMGMKRDADIRTFLRVDGGFESSHSVVYLPLLKFMRNNDTLLDLKQDIVACMKDKGVCQQVEEFKIFAVRNKSNSSVLKSLENKKYKRHQRMKAELPMISDLICFTPLDDDNQTLKSAGLRSGDEVLVERFMESSITSEDDADKENKKLSQAKTKINEEIIQIQRPKPTCMPKRPFNLINPQILVNKRRELDFFYKTRVMDHSDIVRKTFSRIMSELKSKYSYSSQRARKQSLINKRKLRKIAATSGAKFVALDDIIITKKRPLGVGKTAKVFEGILKTDVATKVAIKQFTARYVTTDVAAAFAQEIQALCRVSHKGVVRCLGVYIADDIGSEITLPTSGFQETPAVQLIIVYELCTRGDFRGLLEQPEWRNIALATKLNMIYSAASALAEIHALNIVHRDLKLDNILVSETFELKIGDFGVASLTSDEVSIDCEAKGTLGYTAPEVVSGKSAGCRAGDVFSFGVILYELLSQEFHNPFTRPLEQYVKQFKGNKHIKKLRFAENIPSEVVACVKRCLLENPADRCTAEEIVLVLSSQIADDRKYSIDIGKTPRHIK